MSIETVERGLTVEDVIARLAKSKERFERGDVDAIISRYADDIVVRFADLPEMKGKIEVEKFLRARFEAQGDYKVDKHFLLVSGQTYANSFTGSWTDKATGKRYEARGVEALQLEDGLLKVWDCAYNFWEAGKAKENSYFGKF
jgi:ketosteroid isomerase-like protein